MPSSAIEERRPGGGDGDRARNRQDVRMRSRRSDASGAYVEAGCMVEGPDRERSRDDLREHDPDRPGIGDRDRSGDAFDVAAGTSRGPRPRHARGHECALHARE